MWLPLLDDNYPYKYTRPIISPIALPNPLSRAKFHDLPAELRNQIYNLSLIKEHPIRLPYSYEKVPFTEPSLLSVDRNIRTEATPIYYGCNTFEAPSLASAKDFLHHLSAEKISCLRYFRPIDLILPVTAHRRWFDALRANVNRLVKEGGKGVLRPEAVWIPVREGERKARWRNLRDVKGFRVVEGESEEGCWRIEREGA